MLNNTKEFFEFYCYDNNEDLIIKLCKKFRLAEPNIVANYHGDVDVIFKNNLRIYYVQVLDDKVVLKRREDRNFGQKSTKEYANVVKEYIDGEIWYEVIKKISKDSRL